MRKVVLEGGKGKRLWKMQRQKRKKKFMDMNGEIRIFKMNLKRLQEKNRY